MIFNEWTYIAFLLLAVMGVAGLPPALRNPWLALLGLGFYSYYGGVWVVVFVLEIVISRWYRPGGRMALFGIIQAVLILAVVKYGAFIFNLTADLFGASGTGTANFSRPFYLPLALSFFTFEFIHYAADRYRGKTEAVALVPYAAFILFFPTMIAGPIKRVQGFSHALAAARVTLPNLWAGSTRIAIGLCKKHVLADNASLLIGDGFGLNAAAHARWLMLVWWLGLYGVRIYMDFSAYSDIAIGSARLMGISIPENFNWPYLARNPSEFWRRWHISLSQWITDYIYIPLGGSRGSASRVALNTLAAMTLSGLWHGAALNFVVWGLYHGILLIAYRGLSGIWTRIVPTRIRTSLALRTSYVLATYAAVHLGWVFFAMPLSVAWIYARRLLTPWT